MVINSMQNDENKRSVGLDEFLLLVILMGAHEAVPMPGGGGASEPFPLGFC